jgi:biopolymer transport protein ExbB
MTHFFSTLPMAVKVLVMYVVPIALALGLGIAMAFTKRLALVTLFLYLVGLIISVMIFFTLPDFIRAGGPLVITLILLLILLVTYTIERLFTLKRSRGRASVQSFMREFREQLRSGDLMGAISTCNNQGGATANILRAGLERFMQTAQERLTMDKRITETQRAIEEANMLEAPLLERNLVVLTTIASVATMVGLLGTTIGMIRAFQAMAHAGAPDAVQLAVGISEALINTAGGLLNGIGGIVANNYFQNKVDQMNYQTDEASYEMVQMLTNLKQ